MSLLNRPIRNQEPELLSAESLAKMLEVSTIWLARNRQKKNPIPFIKLGRMIRYKREDVLEWIDKINKQ